ncbi:MAG: class B sortase [Clostridiales bacterium]|nr:class B sortase [Clostridiales bacterium]
MKYKKILKNFVSVLLIAVFGFSVYKIYTITKTLRDVDRTYQQIQEEYIVKSPAESNGSAGASENSEPNENAEGSAFRIRWSELLETNSDVVAWIYIPDTHINYPVLQGKTSDEYLRRDLYKNYLVAGSIFVDSYNAKPFVDYNTVIYGHNMQNETMFSELRNYNKKDFAQAHPKVLIYQPDGTCLTYTVISFHKVHEADEEIYNTNVVDRTAFLDSVRNKNQLLSVIDEDNIESIITLSTCTNGDQEERYVLHAALLKNS